MHPRTLLYALLATGLMSQSLFAGLIAYEGFDYDSSPALPLQGSAGNGWAGPWVANSSGANLFNFLTNDNVSIDPPPSPFTAVGDRVAKSAVGGGGASSSGRKFDNGLAMNTDGVLYVSFSWVKSAGVSGATSANNLEVGLFQDGGNSNVVRFGGTSGNDMFLDFGGTAANTYGAISLGTKYYTVLKLTASASGQDKVEGISYTSVPSGAEPGSWPMSRLLSGVDSLTANQVRLTLGNNAQGQIDEIRVGTTWDEVAVPIPEPTSLALLLLSAITGFCFRNRG